MTKNGGIQQVNKIALKEDSVCVCVTDTKKFSPGTPRPFLSCLQRHILPISDTEMDSKAEYFKSPMRDKSSTEFQFPDGNEHCNHLNANTCFLKHLLRCIVRYNILLGNPRATSPLSTIRHPAHRQVWAPQPTPPLCCGVPSEWWDRVSRLTQEAPIPEPNTVMRLESPPKKPMFSLIHLKAWIWSRSP